MPIHPSLLAMAWVVKEGAIPPADGTAWILFESTLKFPTLAEVHARYDSHFKALRERGDPLADAKEASFYRAIMYSFAEIGPSGILIVHCPYVPID
ncbi:MAG: hypothetical protein WAP23_02690 [Candidatus Spechtbacterales bacterium]